MRLFVCLGRVRRKRWCSGNFFTIDDLPRSVVHYDYCSGQTRRSCPTTMVEQVLQVPQREAVVPQACDFNFGDDEYRNLNLKSRGYTLFVLVRRDPLPFATR